MVDSRLIDLLHNVPIGDRNVGDNIQICYKVDAPLPFLIIDSNIAGWALGGFVAWPRSLIDLESSLLGLDFSLAIDLWHKERIFLNRPPLEKKKKKKKKKKRKKMRPILMKGHERPLTFLKYNREGDLLFSCAKDHTPTVWFADNGERLGTYRGHNGAVWSCDVSRDSIRLITGSADQSAKLWDVRTGHQLHTFNFDSPARSVDFSVGDKLAVITTDPFMGHTSAIHVKRIADDPDDQTSESVLVIKGPQGRINRAVWGPLNQTIISGGEDTIIRIWDSETGKLLNESDKEVSHKKNITSLAKSVDGSHFLTGSHDKSAKLWDTRTLTLIKTYTTERPVNAVAMSPLLDHVVLGGGQDASSVTTTDHRAGKFEAKFFDKILQEEIGGVKGHFGPINALAFNPDGKSFSSGGEDGYVRLHHFDPDYFNIKI
ncbi:Eukaryotic translation initiation factor 3 subunit I [Morus notabilis]|uniref:Eukaryotic translation initiation factor 3 subunit I n=2 Tax=Morus notabilis TaxID=981085 RepID=W9SJS4_9ROSA|nr:Eukaryotic translation initiation factor 3 subunit I [Morus notabilis]